MEIVPKKETDGHYFVNPHLFLYPTAVAHG